MQFTTSGYRQQYNLNPSLGQLRADGNGVARRDAFGLHASSNNTRIIDTDIEASMYGWTPDEKFKMERHLLSHRDFGTSRLVDSGKQEGDELLNVQVFELFLAPGQEIPDEHLDFAKEQSWYKRWGYGDKAPNPKTVEEAEGRLCVFSRMYGGAALKCPNVALEDSDYCDSHHKGADLYESTSAEVGS